MRFKSVLGAFLFIILASFIALIVFIQTKSFGNLVTKIVSDVSQRRLQTKVQVKSIRLSMFPPGLELNQVRVRKKTADSKIDAELGRIGFYISLIEIEEKNLSFGEIRISDSSIRVNYQEKDEELKELDQALIKKIFAIPDELPVRVDTVLIENSRIFANHDLLEARRLKLFRNGKSFVARFHLSNIKPSAENDFSLDEVWGDAEISKNKIQIYRLKVQHDIQTMLVKGTVSDYYRLKNSTVALNGEAQIYLNGIKNEVKLPEQIQLDDGLARISYSLNAKEQNFNGELDVFVESLKSSVLFADEIRSQLAFNNQNIDLKKLIVVHKAEKVELLSPVPVFNIQSKKFLEKPILARVSNLDLNNALRILGPSLRPLKGKLNGDLSFTYDDGDLIFNPKDKFVLNNVGLIVGEPKDPFTILMIKKAVLTNSQFAVIKNEFQMSSTVELARSKFDVDGFVNKNRVQFNVPDAKIDLEDFGNISNLDVKGAGELSINVSGPLDDTSILLKGRTKGFEILGYKLDETEKSITINLGDDNVIINKMESRYGKTNISGNGSVDYGDADIALGISSNDANASDLMMILTPIFSKLDFLPADLDFKAKVDVDIFGKYKLDDLKIRSAISFTELQAYGETIPSGAFGLSLLNNNLSFRNFEAEKGRGRINGNINIGLKDDKLGLAFDWDNIELASLNVSKKTGLNLNSTLSGKIAGNGTTKNYLLKLETLAFNTRTQNYKFDDSKIRMDILPDRIIGEANLLGKIVDTDFNLALKKGIASKLSLKVTADDLKPFLVALVGQHLEAENFTGRLDLEGNTTFQDGFNDLYLTGNLKELSFNHPDFNVNYISSGPQFIVRDSIIQTWNLLIKQPNLYVMTKGEGEFGKNVSLSQEIHFNSKIVEILMAEILSAEGFIRSFVNIQGRGTDFNFSVISKTNDIDLSIDQFPVQLNDLNFDIEYIKNKLSIKNLGTSLDSGSIAVKGDVFFEGAQPDVNLKYVLDKAEIPLFGKSAINLTGDGIILGNNYPYTVGGEIIINKAQIVNELNEFSTKSGGFSQVRFLPKNQESPIGKLLTLNLNIKAENPVRITNSLMDVALIGEIRVFGNPARPRAEGRLSAPINSSRIFFKNNEYQIVSADINFNPKKEISNPDFDIQALTFISSYKVYPKAYGDLERFNFDLTSDPALPRNSILSLIAFGYTDEIQNTLYAKDQQSLTQVGVGSFVFDRFKISDILNKQFGLQVNLGTLIEQSETDSLLSGRSQDSTGSGPGGLGRTRSATKIELKKRLDEALTLSVSSTMGGSIGQRQSMNLNYGISKNVQVEGVYELRTEDEADIIYDSIGGDVKFRRTFK